MVMKTEIKSTMIDQQALSAIIEGVIENYNCVDDNWRIDVSDAQIVIGSTVLKIPKARFLFS